MKPLDINAEQRSEFDTSIPLIEFKSGTIPQNFTFYHTDASIVQSSRLLAGIRLFFKSQNNFYTSTVITPEEGQVWDWSLLSNFSLALDVQNIGRRSTQMFINIFDHKGQMHSRSINVPGETENTYLVELKGKYLKGKTNYYSGFRSNPAPWKTPFEYATWMWGELNLDLTSITKIELCINGSLIDHTLVLSNLRLMLSAECQDDFLKNCIDQYGQNSRADYPEKVHSDDELKRLTTKELEELAKGSLPDRSKFGGFKNGERLKATGYFRTEKYKGKWSLVDPEGYLYFATGMDIIRLANTPTITGIDYDHTKVAQREIDDVTPEDSKERITVSDEAKETAFVASSVRRDCFSWLPTYEEPLGKHYGYMRELFEGAVDSGETYSFYSANLERKYGDNGCPVDKWREVTIDRMLNWGFTSLGNWTAPEYYSNNKVPYFANGWIIGDFKTVSSGDDFWSPLPDPFDPLFRERAEVAVAEIKVEIQDSPWCVGIFIDNEKSWGRMGTLTGQHGIAIHTLSRNAKESPAKAAFLVTLINKYSTVEALNRNWQTDFIDWQEISEGVTGLKHTEKQIEDYGLLLEVFAEQYFKVVNETLKDALPNHLYLGARFADWGMTPDVIRAAAKHVDVMSYNYYKEGLHPEPWSFLEEVDMPSIIGEFHIGAKDSGFFHPGLVSASTQEERGDMFEAYMHTVIDNPYFVGAHWFQYIDSPITGRAYDGENYNIGFVSIADVPYQPMVDAAKRMNGSLYTRRYQK